jgi:tetratricopeptide (TPR) repeat protein
LPPTRPPRSTHARHSGSPPLTTPVAPRAPKPLLFIALAVVPLTGLALHFGSKSFRHHLAIKAVEEARAREDWDQVARAASEALQLRPESTLALLYSGEAAKHRQDFHKSRSDLEKLSKLSPEDPATWALLSELYLGPCNQPLLGEEALQRVIQQSEQSIHAHRELIRYYGLTCQRTKAIHQARQSIVSGSDSPASYVYLMFPETVIYENGETINERWLENYPGHELFDVARLIHRARGSGIGETLDASVDTETRKSQLQELEQRLAEKLDLYPDNQELLALSIGQAADRGDVAQVATLLSNVPAQAVNDARFYRFKGWLHRNREELSQASQAFALSLEKDPYEWKSRYQLAEVLRLQGDTQNAEVQLATANLAVQLRRTLLGLKSIEILPVPVLKQLMQYADEVGDDSVASRLNQRISYIQSSMSDLEPMTIKP